MNGNSEEEYNISQDRMEKLVNIYNTKHHSATGKAPNKRNDTDFDNLIKKKQKENND
jgi:hypothetical protein